MEVVHSGHRLASNPGVLDRPRSALCSRGISATRRSTNCRAGRANRWRSWYCAGSCQGLPDGRPHAGRLQVTFFGPERTTTMVSALKQSVVNFLKAEDGPTAV